MIAGEENADTKHRSVALRRAAAATEQRRTTRTLKARFEKNMNRHQGIQWTAVQARLEANPERLYSLNEMERTGGEPDVVGHDKKTGEFVFYDCSAESPGPRVFTTGGSGGKKEHKEDSAPEMAPTGIEIRGAVSSCRRWAISIRRRRVGRPLVSRRSGAVFTIAVTTMSSRITTVQSYHAARAVEAR
jgi:hypothetical protein